MSFKEEYGVRPLTLITTVLGVFMAVLDSEVVNVAIPKMMSVFATTQSTISWVVTIYLLTQGMLTPASGFIGERFGYKKVFLFALAEFTMGSALCGFSWNVGSIIFFRVIQAMGGAMLIPLSMAILFNLSKPEKRGVIMGFWGIAIIFAPAFGPTLGGYLVEYLDWRLIFFINVPVGILGFLMAKAVLPEFPAKKMYKFDIPGLITSLTGFFCLLYALSDAPDSGWTSLKIISLLTAAAILLSLFVVLELTTSHPMLDLRLLKNRIFTVSVIATGLISMTMLGILFILPVFLQNGLGLSPLETGLLTMPGALVTGLLMPVSGALFDRMGARVPATIGIALVLCLSILLTNINLEWSFSSIMLLYMFRSAGMGLSNMPINTAGMNAVPRPQISQATALMNTMRMVAGSLGTAILSTAMQTHTDFALNSFLQKISAHSLQSVSSYGLKPSVFGLTKSIDMLKLLIFLKQIAFQSGTQYAMKISVIIAALALPAVMAIGKKQKLPAADESFGQIGH
jgi:DHA2 family multidrug resistance protein